MQTLRERVVQETPLAASTAELLGLIIGGRNNVPQSVEAAERILAAVDNNLLSLVRGYVDNPALLGELTPEQYARVTAAFELNRRLPYSIGLPTAIHGAEDVFALLQEMQHLEREELRVITLNTKMVIGRVHAIFKGTVNSTQFRMAEIFKPAIVETAPFIIIVHNHPSGEPDPSPEDLRLTDSAVHAGRLLDIEVRDHVIIGKSRFVSLKGKRLGSL